jgi:hypothetical protein
MSFADVWRELEEAPSPGKGRLARRVHPESAHDIMLAVEHPEQRRLVSLHLFGPPGDQYRQLKPSRGIDVSVSVTGATEATAEIRLTDDRYRDVFTEVVQDVVRAVAGATTGCALDALCGRLRRWQRFLEVSDPGGLSGERQAGLYAELHVLKHTLAATIGTARAVAAWTGPTGTPQDFQVARAAIEVKASRGGEPQFIQVTSERQLDSTGVDALFLVHLALDSRQAGTGQTLVELVDSVRMDCSDNTHARMELDDRLLLAGYDDLHRPLYETTRYSPRRFDVYKVVDGFPRLTEADLPTGVGHVTYRIPMPACQAFLCPVEELRAAVKTKDAK